MPKAAAGQRRLRVPHAARSASKPVPLDAGFRTSASPLWQTPSSKSGLVAAFFSSREARATGRTAASPARCPRSELKSLQRSSGVSSLSPSSSSVSALDARVTLKATGISYLVATCSRTTTSPLPVFPTPVVSCFPQSAPGSCRSCDWSAQWLFTALPPRRSPKSGNSALLPQLPNHVVRLPALKEAGPGEVAAPRPRVLETSGLPSLSTFGLSWQSSGLKPHNSRRVAVEDQRPLALKHGDRRAPREPGSRRARASLRAAPPRPAALREPATGAGGRATPHEKSVLWEPRSVAGSAAGNATHPLRPVFCPRQGTASGRLVWGGICENAVLSVADSQFSVHEQKKSCAYAFQNVTSSARVSLVGDNLNTCTPGAFYEASCAGAGTGQANRCAPKHGNWLNIAENELRTPAVPAPPPARRHRDSPSRSMGCRRQRAAARRGRGKLTTHVAS